MLRPHHRNELLAMLHLYVLQDHIPLLMPDIQVWLEFMETELDARRVAWKEVEGSMVSTVFIGIDHAWLGGPPQLFETMVFGGPLDREQFRCSTWEQAEAMHEAVCARIRAALSKSRP